MSDILAMQTSSKCVLHVVINYKELKMWRWSCLHVSIFWGPVVHESWPLQRTLGRCQLQGLSLTGMTKSLSFSHFPLIFPSFTVKCVYINCAWSHALKITLVKNLNFFFKLSCNIVLIWLGHFTRGISWFFAQFHTWLVLSLSASNDFFLHHFTPGLFRYSLHTMSFTLFHTWPISCLADPEVLWLWGRRMPGRGQVCRPAGGRTQIFNAKGQVWGILCRVHSGTYFILILM